MQFLRDRILIGPVSIHYYALIIVSGAILAVYLAARIAKANDDNEDYLWDMFPWLLAAGVIGARIWHILTPPDSMVAVGMDTAYYLTHPLDALNIKNGGLGIPGGVIGGLAALIIYSKKRKLDFRKWADYIAPGLALAQAIGRWGNFINQELYGAPTDLPWKIFIEPAYRIAGFTEVAYYHPLFLYESLYNLANMGILIWISRAFKGKLKPGDVILSYAVIYPAGRFLLEFLRLDASSVFSLNINQATMGIIAIVSLAVLIWRHRKSQTTGEVADKQESANRSYEDTDIE